jgi:hypothetical protein
MMDGEGGTDRVVILADESANWKIAGLRQLERLALALNETAASDASERGIDLAIFWKPETPSSQRWLPEAPRISPVRLTASPGSIESQARLLATRLFVERNGMAAALREAPTAASEAPAVDRAQQWQQLSEKVGNTYGSHRASEWQLLSDTGDIGSCERRFLRRAGKSQDGLVSKFLNRPVSRLVTRLLLRFPISPTAWTASIFVLPLLACAFLLRGGYIDILIGTLIYQLYSIFDGCDGEIARAKYLESKRGGRIDDLCDVVGALIFVVGLGFGLDRSHSLASRPSFFTVEGILCALLIATNEFLLRIPKEETNLNSAALSAAMYPRHRQLLERAGLGFLGENSVWWFVQITKRDVSILFFILLALLNLPQWILHLWIVVTAVTLSLNATAWLRRRNPSASGLQS